MRKRKELGLPDENRKKAERLFSGEEYVDDGEISEHTDGDDIENDGFGVTSKGKKSKKSANAYAVSLLSARTYTESGLKAKLFSRGYSAAETEGALEYARSFGYINDMRVAENTAARLAARLYGRRRIFAYLASKGIKSDVINALDLSDIDFNENCRALAQRYEAKGASYEKTAAALSRAGFSSSEIYYAMSDFEEYPVP